MPGIGIAISPMFGKKKFNYSSYWTQQYEDIRNAWTTKPINATDINYARGVKTLVDGGVWAKLGYLLIASHINTDGESLINWINPSQKGTIEGTIVLTPGKYLSGDGSSYIKTGWIPSIDGIMKQNNASIGVYRINDNMSVAGTYPADAGVGTGGYNVIYMRSDYNHGYAGSNVLGSVSSTNKPATPCPINGLFTGVRTAVNSTDLYREDVSLNHATGTNSGQPPTKELYVFAYNNNGVLGVGSESSSDLAMIYAGAALTTGDITLLKTTADAFFFNMNNELAETETILNDVDDLYAHESHILMKKIGAIDYLFLLYMSNKVNPNEWQTSAHALLKIYNLSTKAHIRTIDLFYPGLTAGVTMPADKEINVPRMYFYGANILRCFVPNTSALYTRDVDISDSTPANWTAGNISIAQMTMKDAGGSDVVADVTSANIQIHLKYIFGDDYAGYASLMPLLRNLDSLTDGANWYSTLECTGERSHTLPGVTMLIKSTDSGNTWDLSTPIGYTTSNRVKLAEAALVSLAEELHVISRGNDLQHYKSTDAGVTFTKEADLSFYSISTKPCAINDSEGKITLTFNIVSEITDDFDDRTTLIVVNTNDLSIYHNIGKVISGKFCHYPSIRYYGNSLYMSYTKGMVSGDRDSIAFVRIV